MEKPFKISKKTQKILPEKDLIHIGTRKADPSQRFTINARLGIPFSPPKVGIHSSQPPVEFGISTDTKEAQKKEFYFDAYR